MKPVNSFTILFPSSVSVLIAIMSNFINAVKQ